MPSAANMRPYVSLALKVTRGAIWTIVASFIARGAGLVGTLAITYFLAPEVIGEVAVAHVVVFTANQVSIIGFGQYIIAKPTLSRGGVFQVSVLNMGFALLAFAVVWLLSSHLGGAFEAPNMAAFVPGLLLAALLQRVGLIPARILTRDLRFKRISLVRFFSELAYAGVSLFLAFHGWGGKAIVYGNVARYALEAVVYCASVAPREWLTPSRFIPQETRDLFRFGVPVSIGAWLGFAARRWDNLLISAIFGPGVMGMYQMAYNLADVPATQVGEHIGDVLLPSFARLEGDRARAGLIRSTALLGLLVFPLAVGLGAVAPSLVPVLLREEWAGVAPLLTALAGLSVVRPIGWTVVAYLQARDFPTATMIMAVIKLVVLLLAIWLLSFFGPVWATAGVGIAFAAEALVSLWFIQKLDQVNMLEVLKGMLGPLLACAVMVGALLLARLAVASMGLPLWFSLIAEIVAGGLAYVGACFVFAPSVTRDCIALLRRAASSAKDDEDELGAE